MAIYTPILIARFWSKVDVGGLDECWPWRGSHRYGDPAEYGKFNVHGTVVNAHRLAWEIFNGELLGRRLACHICDNKPCCNPQHIYAGDPISNGRDAVERGQWRARDQGGSRNGNARLTDTDLATIRERIASGETNVSIAEDYPVSHSMISRIRRGLSWQKELSDGAV